METSPSLCIFTSRSRGCLRCGGVKPPCVSVAASSGWVLCTGLCVSVNLASLETLLKKVDCLQAPAWSFDRYSFLSIQ